MKEQPISNQPKILHAFLSTRLTRSELKILYLNLNIDSDDFPGETRSELALELVAHAKRKHKLSALSQEINDLFGELWGEFIEKQNAAHPPFLGVHPTANINQRPHNQPKSSTAQAAANQPEETIQTESSIGSIGWGIAFILEFTLIIVEFLLGNQSWATNNIQGNNMLSILVYILATLGFIFGCILFGVGAGIIHFAPNHYLEINKNPGALKLLNFIEMVLGLFLIGSSISTAFDWLYMGDPYFLGLFFGLSLVIGYISYPPLKVIRNTTRVAPFTLSRMIGVVLLIFVTVNLLPIINDEWPPWPTPTQVPTPTPLPELTPTPHPEMMARFDLDQIPDQSSVNQVIEPVNGRHNHLPPDHDLWIIANIGEACYVMNGAVTRENLTGTWQHPRIEFPSTGRTYTLLLALADNDASFRLKAAINNSNGYTCDAIETTPLESITVTVP